MRIFIKNLGIAYLHELVFATKIQPTHQYSTDPSNKAGK